MRDLLATIGAITVGTVFVGAIVGVEEYIRHRPCRHKRETLDIECGWLVWRCLKCGGRRELGYAWCAGTNRQAKR